jgi:hypothetical protein
MLKLGERALRDMEVTRPFGCAKGRGGFGQGPQHRRAPAGPSCMRRSAKRSVKPGRSTMRRAPMDKTPLDRRVTAEGLRIAFDSALAP